MNLLLEAQSLLERSGYEVRTIRTAEMQLIFEDDFIIGMVAVFQSVQSLIDTWQSVQDGFLTTYQGLMQKELDKAWNSYVVFLSTEVVSADNKDKIAAIEENLRGARKIVGTGIVSSMDLEKAFLPILPIQKTVNITREDHLQRLRSRLEVQELFSLGKPEEIFKAMESKK